jgi:hypothetical protein
VLTRLKRHTYAPVVALALQVAQLVLGSLCAERRAQKHWIRETRSRTKYASLPTFAAREAHGAAYAATEDHPLDGGPQKVAKLALARGLRPRASSRHSAKGGASTDALRDPTTSRGSRVDRRVRALEARRQSRRRAKIGGLRSSQARRTPPNRAQRARAIRRKEIDVDTGPKGAEANRELEIGELLRRSIASLPLQPGTCERYAFSEVKPLAEAALATMTALERRRRLTDDEHRQTVALQRLLAVLQEPDREHRAG